MEASVRRGRKNVCSGWLIEGRVDRTIYPIINSRRAELAPTSSGANQQQTRNSVESGGLKHISLRPRPWCSYDPASASYVASPP